jgi:hypothetical protein
MMRTTCPRIGARQMLCDSPRYHKGQVEWVTHRCSTCHCEDGTAARGSTLTACSPAGSVGKRPGNREGTP